MADRTLELAVGKDFILSVDKTGGTSTFTPVGCMESFSATTEKGLVEYSCRDKSGAIPSGKDAVSSISASGITHVYSSGNVSGNTSFKEMENWCAEGTINTWRWGGIYEGDPVYTAKMAISKVTLDNPNDEKSTYTIEMRSVEKRTVSTVPTVA